VAHAGRHAAITPEVARKIEALRDPALTTGALWRKLNAAGVHVARRTLDRYMATTAATGEAATSGIPQEDVMAAYAAQLVEPSATSLGDERFTPAALMGDMRKRYLQACGIADSLQAVAKLGGPEARKWGEAVRIQGEIAEKLARMAPPPIPSPEDDPAYLAAKERLLERAREIAAK
jgi:hypothetical protein